MTPRSFAAALALLAGLNASILHAQTITARGMVFEDRNSNSARDAGERGLPGVLISDGRQIVKTGPDGAYAIDIDANDAHIFVIKPRDFAVPVDRQNIPRFAYIHRPEGSPDAEYIYPGVASHRPAPTVHRLPAHPKPRGRRLHRGLPRRSPALHPRGCPLLRERDPQRNPPRQSSVRRHPRRSRRRRSRPLQHHQRRTRTRRRALPQCLRQPRHELPVGQLVADVGGSRPLGRRDVRAGVRPDRHRVPGPAGSWGR
ncbi:MAG: hypothetical protein HC927_11040 [Deltaproteobacteria bacterium]|nr:hypothetical protein [Deltaproteobacteria bacterium]